MIHIWDARTGELLERLRGHSGFAHCVAFTPDGRGLVSGSFDNTLKYWDISRLANRPDGQPDSPGVAMRDILDGNVGTRESSSPCTMDFIGHKVRVEFADWGCV